jgi:hypothetical protein
VGTLLVTQWRLVTGEFARLGLAVVIFSVAALMAGDRLARALHAAPADRVALALEFVGVQSLGRPDIAGLATVVFVVQVPLLFAVAVGLRRVRSRPTLAPLTDDPA